MTGRPLPSWDPSLTGRAVSRLLDLAESDRGIEGQRAARFLAGLQYGDAFPFDLHDLRHLPAHLVDDMITCMEASRRPGLVLMDLVEDGRARLIVLMRARGLQWT